MEEGEANDDQVVDVFSSGWNRKFVYLSKESPKQISVELLEPDTRAELALSWLEMSRSPMQGLLGEKHGKKEGKKWKEEHTETVHVPGDVGAWSS